MSASPSADLRHLGDFTTTSRVLTITAFALPIGVFSAGVAWALLRLIGLITNVVFYQRLGLALVAPSGGHHSPALILLAPGLRRPRDRADGALQLGEDPRARIYFRAFGTW